MTAMMVGLILIVFLLASKAFLRLHTRPGPLRTRLSALPFQHYKQVAIEILGGGFNESAVGIVAAELMRRDFEAEKNTITNTLLFEAEKNTITNTLLFEAEKNKTAQSVKSFAREALHLKQLSSLSQR